MLGAVALAIGAFPVLSQQPTPAVKFTDITDAAGIRFRHASAPEKKYIVESMSGGVALFDYDNDGWLDIYFTNSPTVETADQPHSAPSALYHNNHDGTFTDVTAASGLADTGWAMGVVAADFDGDGWQDLYVTCFGPNHLYRNQGDGTFADVTAAAGVQDTRWSSGAAFGDFDRDGLLDLFVANYVDFKLSDLPSFGKGKFCQYKGIEVQCGPRGLPGAGDSLFHALGGGKFADVSRKAGVADPDGRYGLGVVWTDIDEDGWQDLYVANDTGPNFLYHNNHDGSFSESGYETGVAVGEDGQEQGSMGIAVGDYLHTGRLSLFVTNFSDEYNALYRHDRPTEYSDESLASKIAQGTLPYVGWGTAFFDYDNDGWLDVLVVNGHVYPQVANLAGGAGYQQRAMLYRNLRDGMFGEVAAETGNALTTPLVSRGAAFGDIDNDGDVDVVINNLDGKPLLLRNDGGNRNHWISIRCRGRGANRDALGARVKVSAGGVVQWGEIRSGGSYLSASDLRLHFGLGEATRVDSIEIHWPGGGVRTMQNTAADQFLTIEEETAPVKVPAGLQ